MEWVAPEDTRAGIQQGISIRESPAELIRGGLPGNKSSASGELPNGKMSLHVDVDDKS